VGTTARLDALQAAILRPKLARLDHWNDQRRRLGAALRERLAPVVGDGVDGADLELVGLPFDGADHVYHLFVVRTSERDALRAHLSDSGVASAVHYPVPIHLSEAYAELDLAPGSLPVCEALSRRICSLPLFPGMTDAQLDRVAEAVLAFTEVRPAYSR
jgi:dTDP-4-amino-4,6-dideoxygalactose transaminase